MKSLKLFLSIIILIFFICSLSNAQEVFKFRAKFISFCPWEEYIQDWGEWSDYEEVNILIVINLEDERISIFSNETQTLDIYEYDSKEEYNKTVLLFKTIDKYGDRCSVKYVFYEDDENRQLYVTYSKIISVVYELKAMSKY